MVEQSKRQNATKLCFFTYTQSQVPPEQWALFGTTDPVIQDVKTNNGLESNNNIIKTVFLPQGGVGISKVCNKMSQLFAMQKHKLAIAIKKVMLFSFVHDCVVCSHTNLKKNPAGISSKIREIHDYAVPSLFTVPVETPLIGPDVLVVPTLLPHVQAELDHRNAIPVATPGDGLCQYTAIGIAAMMTQHQVRTMITRVLRTHAGVRAFLEPILVDGETPDTIANGVDDGQQGTMYTLIAAATGLGRVIIVLHNHLETIFPHVPERTVTIVPLNAHGDPIQDADRDNAIVVVFEHGEGEDRDEGHYTGTRQEARHHDPVEAALAIAKAKAKKSSRIKAAATARAAATRKREREERAANVTQQVLDSMSSMPLHK